MSSSASTSKRVAAEAESPVPVKRAMLEQAPDSDGGEAALSEYEEISCSDDDDDDAEDEEQELADFEANAGADDAEAQTRDVLRALGLESTYQRGLSFLDALLGVTTIKEHTREALAQFRASCLARPLPASTEPTDAFLNHHQGRWACNDRLLTAHWDELVRKLEPLGVSPQDLVKPSGAMGVCLVSSPS